jgi:hypothetical protein
MDQSAMNYLSILMDYSIKTVALANNPSYI